MTERFRIMEPIDNESHAEQRDKQFAVEGGYDPLSEDQEATIRAISQEIKYVAKDPDGGLNEKVAGAPAPLDIDPKRFELP